MQTLFVTGGAGFIGRALVRRAWLRVKIHALARTSFSAAVLSGLGAEPIEGDLEREGRWQKVASKADGVIHLAQPPTFRGRVTRRRAEEYRARRLAMDANLFDALDGQRLVYVAGTGYYGAFGPRMRDEFAEPRPRGWGTYVAPAIAALLRRVEQGFPAVLAFPGYVYGDGSWFREYVLAPLRAGAKINVVSGPSRHASPVHVGDCARALLHLLDAGELGGRYFVVDDKPLPWLAFYRYAAEAVGVPLRLRHIPAPLMRLLIGNVVTDSLLSDTVLANARLRATGFAHKFPSSKEGTLDVVRGAAL